MAENKNEVGLMRVNNYRETKPEESADPNASAEIQ